MTLVLFALVRVVPRVAARIGDLPLLVGGLLLAGTGMAWLSQITETTGFVLGIGAPLILMGVGMGAAFTPLTTAGIHAVAPDEAGAASGLANAAHQLRGPIRIAVLGHVFARAGGGRGPAPAAGWSTSRTSSAARSGSPSWSTSSPAPAGATARPATSPTPCRPR